MGQHKKNNYVYEIHNFAYYQDTAHTMVVDAGVHVYRVVSHKPVSPPGIQEVPKRILCSSE